MPSNAPSSIFMIAGETSGDLLGANLARELLRRQPDLQADRDWVARKCAPPASTSSSITGQWILWVVRGAQNLRADPRGFADN